MKQEEIWRQMRKVSPNAHHTEMQKGVYMNFPIAPHDEIATTFVFDGDELQIKNKSRNMPTHP